MRFEPVAVIPVYNHPRTIGAMTAAVLDAGLHCVLVDDGSAVDCATVLDRLAAQAPDRVTLLRLPTNQGKGGAMAAGLRCAAQRGATHALQIDADGQHDPADIPQFLALARQYPAAVIAGCPTYDDSVPRSRFLARYLTHGWVWIHTLSFQIADSMCGFRVYPLAPTLALIDAVAIGRRMDFDTDILVRLHWRGVAVVNRRTRVRYPLDGVSHFRLWRDNLLITRMHTRLFFGMLVRLPQMLWRRAARR